ncbi:MAG: glycosyltransferase [Deltaproteobacteria bacterium]|nr:MAG: glycosyltransferase [Deltaproteobacteria bacterium]
MTQLVSLVVPVFNEEECVPLLSAELARLADRLEREKGLRVETVLVDDGSSDRSRRRGARSARPGRVAVPEFRPPGGAQLRLSARAGRRGRDPRRRPAGSARGRPRPGRRVAAGGRHRLRRARTA